MSDHSFIPKANPKIVPPAIPAPRKESLEQENARLKAEVERLTKAHSDALADFWNIHKGYFDLKAEVEQLRKEGKQPGV